jgi:hypothetical protein
MQIGIASGFYESDSLPISAQECINFYPNIVQTQGLSQETLFNTPGLTQLDTAGNFLFVCRGAETVANKPYFVLGDDLFRLNRTLVGVDYTYALENLGTIGGGVGRVSMADNGTQLMILVPGGNGYILNVDTDTLTQIVDVDFTANGNPQYAVYVDGYFVCTTDSKKFISSAINDGLAWNALDFGTAEADPDDIVAPIVFKNELYIGGTESIEGFQNRPSGADFPFVRTGLFLSKGIKAPFSIVAAEDTFMFIGGGKNESPAIWAFAGNTVRKVSTTAIDSILQRFSDDEIMNSFAWSYSQKGAYFVGFSLSTTTLVLDTVTGRWHERKSETFSNVGTGTIEKWRVNSVIEAYNLILCGDSKDGRIGSLGIDIFTEYGNKIKRSIATQPLHSFEELGDKSFAVPRIELTIESGVGDFTTTDPQIEMDISEDGGKTWGYKRARSMGKIGEYSKRCVWRRNGRIPRFAVFRWAVSDPVKPVIIRADAEFK